MQNVCVCVFGCSTLAWYGCTKGTALSQIAGFTVGHRDMESSVLLITSGFVALSETSSLYKCVFTSLKALKIGKSCDSPNFIGYFRHQQVG